VFTTKLDHLNQKMTSSSETQHNRFVADYIVVGAGSSGCVLAAKLAKTLKSDKIVILEAGGTNDYSFVRDFRESLYMPPDEQPKVC
jgi:choline dehydrogenase-like flavoprotein